MRNSYAFSIALLLSLACLSNLMAQFTGGNAAGYAAATSVTQQLNPPLFNDLQLVNFTQPADNQSLNINTNYHLTFTVKNTGTYPVFPNDSIFFTVKLNANIIIDSFFFTSPDTLQVGASTNKTFPNIFNFSDSTANAQLCVTINGTSFAADSVVSDNSLCNTINITDPSGIDSYQNSKGYFFYNPLSKCVILKDFYDVQKIYIYDLMGREMPFIAIAENEIKILKLLENYPQIIFIKVYSEHLVFSKKLLLF